MACTELVMVAVLAVVAVQAEVPWFCGGYDCPAFTSQDRGSYEIRNYVQTNWVTTTIDSNQPDPDRSESSSMFRKLFNYISGDNVNGQKIDMTVPVLTRVEKRAENDYQITMMFYLPFSNPPAPLNNQVTLLTKPAGNMFVRSFPGWWWPSKSKYRREWETLKTAIGDSTLFADGVYYKAGYNSPYDFFKRKQFEVLMDSL